MDLKASEASKGSQIRTVFLIAVFIVAFSILIQLIWLSFYFVPAGDDFFGIKYLAKLGFWGVNKFVYDSWDARYTATFLSISFFNWIGPNYYGFSGLILIALTLISFFWLFLHLVSQDYFESHVYPRCRLASFTLIFWAFYWVLAKPDVIGNSDFVLVGQFFYNAGAYCYQTSLILMALIFSGLIDFHRAVSPRSTRSRGVLGGLIIICLFLLVGTNEGAVLMMMLSIFYGLYRFLVDPIKQNKNSQRFSSNLLFWILMFFILTALLIFVIYASGDQQRILYYQMKPDIYFLDHDWLFSITNATTETFFLLIFFIGNPVVWFLAWLFYPELNSFMKARSHWLPEQDFWVILIGLIWVGFFSVAWSMGCDAPPRYYGLMATLGFFTSLGLWTLWAEKFRQRFLRKNKLAWLGLVIAGISLVLSIGFYQDFLPVMSDLPVAIKKGPEFKKSYENIVKKLKQAQAEKQKEIILTPAEFLPQVPLLDYFIALPRHRFENNLNMNERTKLLAEDLAYHYGVDRVVIHG